MAAAVTSTVAHLRSSGVAAPPEVWTLVVALDEAMGDDDVSV